MIIRLLFFCVRIVLILIEIPTIIFGCVGLASVGLAYLVIGILSLIDSTIKDKEGQCQ